MQGFEAKIAFRLAQLRLGKEATWRPNTAGIGGGLGYSDNQGRCWLGGNTSRSVNGIKSSSPPVSGLQGGGLPKVRGGGLPVEKYLGCSFICV